MDSDRQEVDSITKTIEVSGESFWVLVPGHLSDPQILNVNFGCVRVA